VKKLLLLASLACGFLFLNGCGGGAPSATHLSVVVTGTATAGTPLTITVNALDSAGNVVTRYTGTVTLTSSDPQAALPSTATLTSGTATAQVTLKTSGNQTVTATDALHALAPGMASLTVSPAVAAQFSFTVPSASQAAGTAFNIAVNALDAFGNVAASYAGTAHFTSSDPQATLPADSKLANGTGSFSVTLKTAGSQAISATDTSNSSITGSSSAITVNPGTPSQLVTSAPAAVTAGIAFNVTVNAEDAFGNVATSYTGTVHFTSTDAQAVLPANATPANGTGMFSVTLKTLGPQTITAADTVTASLKGTSSENVVSNAATHISITGPSSINTRQTFQLTINALDAANNVSVGYAGTVHFSSTDSQAVLPANSTLPSGTATVSATLETVGGGTQTITATDTVTSSITGLLPISVAAPADLAITSGNPPNGTVGVVYGRLISETQYQICIAARGGLCASLTYRLFPGVHCTFNYSNVPCWTGGTRIVHLFQGFKFRAGGGVPAYSWAVSGMPAGLTLVAANGEILGTPTSPGTFTISVTVTDSGNPSVQTSGNVTLTIAPPPPPVVNATPTPQPAGENIPFSFTFTGTGYPPLTWSESGALPAGVALDSSTGILSGTPTQTGSFPISVTATDQFSQQSAALNLTIIITAHGFVATGSMATARRFHTATLLGNGKVLIAGGEDAGATAFSSAELYDPATGMFTPTTHSMTTARAGHTATLLQSGKVLIAGGATDATEAATSTAELYDPLTDTFTATGNMTAARVVHTATLLQSGKVLIAGGDVIFYNGLQNTSIMSLASAEIFDPGSGTFTATTGNMTVPRESHTATLLNSGKVLISGGSDGTLGNPTPTPTLYASSETFDPSTGMFTAAGMMTIPRDFHTANLLGSGKVLMAGGESTSGTTATADLFDPSSASFSATGKMTEARFYHDASTLSDGTILVTGGSDDTTRAKATAEIFDPNAATFAITGSMNAARVWHTSTLLPNGKVLVAGGADINSTPLATAELYQ
jgi:predicted RNA methylase